MVALIRVTLAFVAFSFTYIDQSAPPDLIVAVYATLTLYSIYSVALYLVTARRASFIPAALEHWIDITWYLVLIALSGGSSSVYFLLFFFAILVAAFRSGVNAGLWAAAFSAALFTMVGYPAAPADEFQLSRFLLRPIFLLVLGYLIAYWGGQERKLQRQLGLLKDVTGTLNPRFGTSHLIGHVVRMLREFYEARACLLVFPEEGADSARLFRAEAGGDKSPPVVEQAPAESVRALLPPQGEQVLICTAERRGLWSRALHCEAFDVTTHEPAAVPPDVYETISHALGARCFLSLPVDYRPGVTARLFVADATKRLNKSDADFIIQVFEQTKPFIENVRLVDTLASGAAQEERQRIARDIHDGVIQPYIGLQLGLEALRRLADGNGELAQAIERLLALTESGVEELREYVGGLKAGGARKGSLLPALRRFGAKFSEATDIAVRVESNTDDLFINDRLAGEVFQMATEALSNIRRHTEARAAVVHVGCDSKTLRLRVTNDGRAGDNADTFSPRSITERAASLGGTVTIRRPAAGGAVVEVKIPL
jgi:signal transduction histidine kinase